MTKCFLTRESHLFKKINKRPFVRLQKRGIQLQSLGENSTQAQINIDVPRKTPKYGLAIFQSDSNPKSNKSGNKNSKSGDVPPKMKFNFRLRNKVLLFTLLMDERSP